MKENNSMRNLTTHLKSHVRFFLRIDKINFIQFNIRPFNCTVCSKKFKLKTHLKQHTGGIHAKGKESHHCLLRSCTRLFKNKTSMRNHYDSYHLRIARYICNMKGCSQAYHCKSNLSYHQCVHKGMKPFTCSFCSKTFASKGNLKNHMQKHIHLQKL